MKDEIEFKLNFSDTTILEADGDFDEVSNLMTSEFPHPEDWMLRSKLTVDSPFGTALFVLHFYANGRIIIMDYDSTGGDALYNPDIAALCEWSQQKGWRVPEPSDALVKANVEFWKHFWNTLLVDSAYLDSVFGERQNLQPQEPEPEEKDEKDK